MLEENFETAREVEPIHVHKVEFRKLKEESGGRVKLPFVRERRNRYQKVFYGTDRKIGDVINYNKYYSNERDTSNVLHYGNCIISIPKKHKEGNIETPGLFRRIFLKNPEDPNKHVCIRQITEMNQEKFISDAKEFLWSTDKTDAMIFIHGYNVSFQDSVKRAAQLAYDIDFKGITFAYSWASDFSLLGYISDGDVVKFTVPHLKTFLEKIHQIESISRIHIVAHSMGTLVLTQALEEFKLQKISLLKISQIILAAPDIDAVNFSTITIPQLMTFGLQKTLYASSKDKALKFSRLLRKNNTPRAGQSGEFITVVNGIDTVDASKIDTNFIGHGYFAETAPLLNDIRKIVLEYLQPKARKLEPRLFPPDKKYWLFPEQ